MAPEWQGLPPELRANAESVGIWIQKIERFSPTPLLMCKYSEGRQVMAQPDFSITDEDLVKRVANGDQEAFRTLFESYGERVFRYAHRLISQVSVAEEVTNDVMLEMWKSAARFEQRSKVSTWILGITRNLALNGVRGLRVTTVDLDQVAEPVDDQADPESALLAQDPAVYAQLLRKALRSLSIEHRDVVELTFYQGLSYPEIAKVVGCPENTVKTRMFHAKRKLKRALGVADVAAALELSGSNA